MTTGRPPKPIELKRKLGNPGKRRLPAPIVALEPAVKPSLPPAPSHGDAVVEELWGVAGGWLAKSDALVLIPLLRDGLDRRRAILEYLAEVGWSYESVGPLGNKRYAHPEVVELRNLEKQITSWLSLLGLTPTDRARLGVAEVRARSKLEELEERRAKRLAAGGRQPS